MPKTLQIRLAQTKEEFEAAYKLLARSRTDWDANHGDLWLIKQHALPSTTTAIAVAGHEIIGAISLFGENPFLLPVEEKANLRTLKEDTQGRLAEISYPGLSSESDENLMYALFDFITQFGFNYCHFDTFVFNAPKNWSKKYASQLSLKPLAAKECDTVFTLFPNEEINYGALYEKNLDVEFMFPEKKFFLVAHQSMRPEVLHYLFNVKTNLFECLTDLEIRVLKNIYDYGDYAKAIPTRKSKEKFFPKSRRFPMNCQGELKRGNGDHSHLVVMDVSRDGIKLKTEEPMKQGEVCALTISIGVMKRTEIIAKVVWVDDYNRYAGLMVKSGDHNWTKLIEYLEKDFLLCA